MSTLLIRNIPPALYSQLSDLASCYCISISKQAVISLAEGLRVTVAHKERRRRILSQIPVKTDEANDTEAVVREDRSR
ncbi:MAG: hypothetical protein WCP97_01650 [bacterium]